MLFSTSARREEQRCIFPFFEEDSLVLSVDLLCSRYHQRPSDILCIPGDLYRLDFDLAVVHIADIIRKNERKKDEYSKLVNQFAAMEAAQRGC
ncbi:hypothetical protein LCGC14_1576000 [marine sediment metagenome]|uniref:Uncharacterized protein n=1 Tax=marine sediment metagenome TaxID=412755 RepID=A0A0F9J4G2_9ZZZZ